MFGFKKKDERRDAPDSEALPTRELLFAATGGGAYSEGDVLAVAKNLRDIMIESLAKFEDDEALPLDRLLIDAGMIVYEGTIENSVVKPNPAGLFNCGILTGYYMAALAAEEERNEAERVSG